MLKATTDRLFSTRTMFRVALAVLSLAAGVASAASLDKSNAASGRTQTDFRSSAAAGDGSGG